MKFDVTALAQFADPRDGVLAYHELRAIGMSKAGIHRCCDRGILRRVEFGIYVFGPIELSFRGWVRVATLRGGNGSAAHHYASLALQGIVSFEPRVIDVLTPNRRSGDDGVRFLRQRTIDPADIVICGHVPVTSIARAMVGLAETIAHDRITKLLRETRYRHLLDLDALIRCTEDTRSRQARATMSMAIERLTAGSNGSWSGNESLGWDVLHDLVEDETPLQNPRLTLSGQTVHPDILWRSCGVLVEIDGYPHLFDDIQLDDADRDRHYRSHDYTPIRVLPHDLKFRPDAVRADVRRAILAARARRV